MYQGDGLHGPIRVKPRSDREHPFHMITDDTSEIKEIEEAVTNAQTLFVS